MNKNSVQYLSTYVKENKYGLFAATTGKMNFATSNLKRHILVGGRRFFCMAGASATKKPTRFYKDVYVEKMEHGGGTFSLKLDNHYLKSPAGKILSIDSEPLARLIANEWESQDKEIRGELMHLTSLAFTAQDNPYSNTSQSLISDMMEYASADTLLYYANRQTSLSDEQHKKWTPIIEWINSRFDMELKPTEDPTGQPTISVESRKKLEQFLSFYQFPALVGIKFAAETLKSIILTIAVLSHRLTAEEAVKLARLESVYQSNIWGSFEWSHDMEHHDLSLRFSSSILFAHFSSNYYDIK